MLFVAIPLALFAGLLLVARRRAEAEADADAEAAEEHPGGPVDGDGYELR